MKIFIFIFVLASFCYAKHFSFEEFVDFNLDMLYERTITKEFEFYVSYGKWIISISHKIHYIAIDATLCI